MTTRRTPVPILMADDDPDDRLLARDALAEACVANELCFVEDGEELLEYLHGDGRWAPPARPLRPGLILLDLNMPRKDGREALREIKADPGLRRIPVVVLTTSRDEEDVLRCYDLGASSYITKPVTFHGLVSAMTVLGRYWFEIVNLPRAGEDADAR
ncbi:MAG: response regulator receiver protein [Gemmatimonadetes bacterium]|nr:response regulator receiver protein [Gemmatimonadota bacterium]